MKEGFDSILRDYIEFVDRQSGMYMDALSGFAGNRKEIERQVHLASHAVRTSLGSDGVPVIMRASYEDPTKPDVIHQRIIKVVDYLAENADGGSHEQQHAQAVIVFLYTYWELETRPRLAAIKGCDPNEITSPIMGELRVLRNVILHAQGIVRADKLRSMPKLGNWFVVDQLIQVSFENMKQIFIWLHQACALLLFERMNIPDAKEKAAQIVTLAFENVPRK
jgi:hypothetical protein